jgi:ubiquinone/menaquinone biosynthesis C-methylase UbiE
MPFPYQIVLGLVILFFLVGTFWRLSSRRTSVPCPSWLAWLVEMENPFARNYNASSIIQQLGLRPGMKVLDAGCGPGRVSIPLAKALGSQGGVVAIDIQPRMLNRAREKAGAAGVTNIDFRNVAIERGKLGTAEYDRVLLVTVLGEIPDREAAFQEIHRALKPDGIFSVTEIVFDPHYQTRRSILQLASSAGFREKAFFGNRFAFTLQLEKAKTD